jgi:hypothetical protein
VHVSIRAARVIGLSLSASMLALCAPSPAVAGKKECANAYVEAQKLKQEGSFRKAREQLITCSKNECMAAVRKDCVAWLDEVNASIPSIVVEAKGPDGKETFEVRVSAGDELIAEKLDVNAIELDPGTHTLRFELAGVDPIEKQVVLRQGQKNKIIQVSFEPERAPKPIATDSADPVPVDAGDGQGAGPPVLAYVLGGVGVLALAGAGYFWLSASSSEKELEDSGCEPSCADGDVDSIRQKRLFGDIGLGIGVVSLGIATYLLLTPEKKTPPSEAARLDVRVAPGGAFAGVSGHF